MTSHRRIRIAVFTCFFATTLFGWSSAQAAGSSSIGTNISWQRHECTGGLPPNQETLLFQCGPNISYHLASGGGEVLPKGCAIAEGSETPALYPAAPSSSGSSSYPCADGTCLCEAPSCDVGSNGRPWVAVIDRDDWHGRTQAAVISEIAGSLIDVALLPLDASLAGTALAGLEGPTDLHLLATLCQIIDDAETSGKTPPSVVSMSFGRATSCSDAEDVGGHRNPTPTNTLADEISWALDQLRGNHAAIPVAAHGNHDLALFPSSDPSVESVGTLNLASYTQSSFAAEPSWETPDGYSALLPGNGLCIPFEDPSSDGYWRSPAGSSYANALFAGWLADARDSGWLNAEDLAVPGVLHPVPDDIEIPKTFALARDGAILSGTWSTPASELLARLLDSRHACWSGTKITPPTVATPGSAADPLSSLPSPEQLACDEHTQTPETDYCIPCMGHRNSPGKKGGPISSLTVDLSAPTMRSDDVEVRSVMLRVGEVHRYLELPDGALADLNNGALDSLDLDGFGIKIEDDLSLVWEMENTTTHKRFWTSSPIYIPAE